MKLTVDTLWQALEDVKDPEIPVISVVEMGIVREVALEDDRAVVTMTPTFSGCPALDVMRRDIAARLRALGLAQEAIEVRTILAPPWSSDWISDAGRAKLKAFGLAPPPVHGGSVNVMFFDVVACPYCDGTNTNVRNTFGPTLCRAIYYCRDCQEAFEQFKPI
jgi:ring-1,2-phenylacetyl-CoA epoxidase subunit PaaD